MNAKQHTTHIIIIDDDESYCQLLTCLISKSLPEIEVTAYDPVANDLPGKDFPWKKYDLLILDYQLDKNVTGLDFIQANKNNTDLPAIIMLTAEGNEEIAVLALKHGVNDYLNKTKLTKTHLKDSILETLEEHRKKREAQNKLLETTQTFNKSDFYGRLENEVMQNKTKDRVLLMISIDDYEEIEKTRDYITADKIISYVAKETHKSIKGKEYNPVITRFSDSSIALLIDYPHGPEKLAEHIEKYLSRQSEKPYEIDGEPIQYELSVGAVILNGDNQSVKEIIKRSRDACEKASGELGSSYHISDGDTDDDELIESTGETVEETYDDEDELIEPLKDEVIEVKKETKEVKEELIEPVKETKKEVETIELDVNQVISENRIMQHYQPIMPLSDSENRGNTELYQVCAKMINTDGTSINQKDIEASLEDIENQKLLDQWMLRRCISRLVKAKEYTDTNYLLFIELSKASLEDPSLINWIEKLMEYVSLHAPGKSTVIGISISTLLSMQKQTEDMMTLLRKSFGFKFFLYDIEDVNSIKENIKSIRFDYIKVPNELIFDFTGNVAQVEDTEDEDGYNSEFEKGLREVGLVNVISEIPIIADQVENPMILTTAIAAGADFAIGNFIGEPQEQLEEIDKLHLEFFEIT